MCVCVCANHCAQLSYTTQHTVLIISSLICHTIIIAPMPSIVRKGGNFSLSCFIVNVNVNNRFIQCRVMKHLYCTVCAEWQRRDRFVFSDCLKLLLLSAGSRSMSGSEFQTVGPATEKADNRKCWACNVVWSGDVEWLTVNDVGWECLWDWCTSSSSSS